MATYRYFLCDLMSNDLIQELPLESVTFSRRLSSQGNFQAFFGLDRDGFDNNVILDATAPVRTCTYIERDGKLIWGGINWTRTWSEQSKTLQLTGQTFDSYWAKVDIESTLSYQNRDQRNIIIELINTMQSKSTRNIRIRTPSLYATNIMQSARYNDYECWTYAKAIEFLMSNENSPDYTVDVRYDEDQKFERRLLIDDRLGASIEETAVTFNYPGNVRNFWFPENCARAATSVKGVGAGEGSGMFRVAVSNSSLTSMGYPELVEFYTDKSVLDANVLRSKALSELTMLTPPVTVPTFETNSEMEPQFGSYNLGDYVRINVESSRFPQGKSFTSRIIGWDVTPTRGDTQENVSLVLQGAEDEV